MWKRECVEAGGRKRELEIPHWGESLGNKENNGGGDQAG
jgi:hypothetical protein